MRTPRALAWHSVRLSLQVDGNTITEFLEKGYYIQIRRPDSAAEVKRMTALALFRELQLPLLTSNRAKTDRFYYAGSESSLTASPAAAI